MKNYFSLFIAITITLFSCKKEKPVETTTVPTVTTTAATEVQLYTARVGGEIKNNGNLEITEGGFCYATHPNPNTEDLVSRILGLEPKFTYELYDLVPDTKYYVKAYATNSAGTSYGNEISFTTGKGEMAKVTTAPFSNTISQSAVGGGDVTSDGGAGIFEKGVVYSTNPNPTINDQKKDFGSQSAGAFQTTLHGLASNTKYYLRAYAINYYGVAYGNQVTFTSLPFDGVTDVDGNIYAYITIGKQKWMTSNLRVTHYRNGDPINSYTDRSSWDKGFYLFAHSPRDTKEFGLYYTQKIIHDPRNIAPVGWHIPTDAEWKELEMNQGMSKDEADDVEGKIERGTIGEKLLVGGSSGLNIQHAGGLVHRTPDDLSITRYFGLYWSSTIAPDNLPIIRRFLASPIARQTHGDAAISVRCVKD